LCCYIDAVVKKCEFVINSHVACSCMDGHAAPCSLQDKLEEYAEEIFGLLDMGAHIYFCGLKGMMPGINDTLKAVCESRGLVFEHFTEKLKEANQWHVEVY
jgi:sulfite reductase alpha subunit-like flavoprotein